MNAAVGSSDLGSMVGQRTESFLNALHEMENDLTVADAAMAAMQDAVKAFAATVEQDSAACASAEAEWLAEVEAMPLSEDEVDAAAAEAAAEAAAKRYWTTSRQWREVLYGDCDWDDDVEDDEDGSGGGSSKGRHSRRGRVDVVLDRRSRKGDVFIKVKWCDIGVVSWEREEDLRCTGALDAARMAVAQQRDHSRRHTRLRPAVYHRGAAAGPGVASGYPSVWSCEVERYIWIPYDAAVQQVIENAFRAGQPKTTIRINNHNFEIDFASMMQRGGGTRRVERREQVPEDVIRERIARMSLPELRAYLGTIADFTPAHYEALSRLHELDKVPVHLSKAQIAALPSLTFERMMSNVCEGVEYAAFSTECSMCLEDYVADDMLVMMPACGHLFHKTCASAYFIQYSKLCPYCKEPVV